MIIVDRIEGSRAILEADGELVELPLSVLPEGTEEGAVLELMCAPGDSSATARQQATVELVEQLRASDPGDMEIDI